MKKSKTTLNQEMIRAAAQTIGKLSWQARLKRYGLKSLKQKLSEAGKAAAKKEVSGRPRLADDQVKPSALYQRERRARLKAKQGQKKGSGKYVKTN
jgi:hypothetical protein